MTTPPSGIRHAVRTSSRVREGLRNGSTSKPLYTVVNLSGLATPASTYSLVMSSATLMK